MPYLFNFSAIIFPVYFREHCATIPARNDKKIRKIIYKIDIKKTQSLTYLMVQLSLTWLTDLG